MNLLTDRQPPTGLEHRFPRAILHLSTLEKKSLRVFHGTVAQFISYRTSSTTAFSLAVSSSCRHASKSLCFFLDQNESLCCEEAIKISSTLWLGSIHRVLCGSRCLLTSRDGESAIPSACEQGPGPGARVSLCI